MRYHTFGIPAIIALLILGVVGCTSDDVTHDRQQTIPQFNNFNARTDINSDAYIIKRGDEVQIAVWGYSEFNTTTTVKEAGTIAVPLVGELHIEGLSIDQVKRQLLRKLADYVQGEIKLTVTVASSVEQNITVLGSVVRQANIPVKTDLSLMEVLSAAGGTTQESDLRHVKIFPAGNDQAPVELDLGWYMEYGGVQRLPMVKPGDTVFIPKKENVVRDFSDFARDIIVLFGFFRIFN